MDPFRRAIIALVSTSGRSRSRSTLVETRCRAASSTSTPALLIPAIVVLSQFGLIWLFAAAPVIAIVRDIARYANARLADPPGRAGVLPGETREGHDRREARRATGAVRLPGTRARPAAPTAAPAPVPTAATVAAASPAPRLPVTTQRSTQP